MIACLYGPQRNHIPVPVPPKIYPSKVVTTKPRRTPLPDGVELTLTELQEMAARQQQQIDSQQQMLVAKEQRVKFLKQQEQRHQQIAAENERLQRLRERVETQEMKLQKLRALRGQVDQQKINNSSLTTELESIRSLFNAKEKELSVAVAKVEQLTKQLEEVRKGRINGVGIGAQPTAAAIELEKLRRELLFRNKLNEQQNNKLAQQREILNQRTEEMARIDKRIAELQQRLHRKRLLNQQLSNQINAAASAKQAQLIANQKNRGRPLSSNIAAVEPYQHTPSEQERALDDLHTKLNSKTIVEELPEFHPSKNDPKYQTLPYNTKFTAKYGAKMEDGAPTEGEPGQKIGSGPETQPSKKPDEKLTVIQNGRPQPSPPQQPLPSSGLSPQTVHSIPAYAPSKAHATAVSQGKPSMLSNSVATPLDPAKVLAGSSNFPSSRQYGTVYSSTASLANSNNHCQVPNKPPMLVAPPYIPPPSSNTTMKVQKDVAAPPASLVHHIKAPVQAISSSQVLAGRPSTIYQTSSTRILPVTPHTLGTTPQGVLREVSEADVQHTQAGNADGSETSDGSATDSGMPKPSLPPKPCIPQKPTPPPRQTHGGIDKARAAGKLDAGLDADSTIATQGNGQQTGNHRYASKTVIANTYTRKVNNGALDQYIKNVNQFYSDNVTPASAESDASTNASEQSSPIMKSEQDSPQKRPTLNELPIKPKPLTIKKQTGVEPPKLKGSLTSNVSSSSANLRKQADGSNSALTVTTLRPSNETNTGTNSSGVHPTSSRRIEIPPAFLFPEDESAPSDINSSNVVVPPGTVIGEIGSEGSDVTDHAHRGPTNGISLSMPYDNEKLRDNNYSYGNNKGHPEWDKRRPMVDGKGIDVQTLLDANANNELNLSEGISNVNGIIEGSSKVDESVENLTSKQRQAPVGGAIEENNNCDENLVKSKDGEEENEVRSEGQQIEISVLQPTDSQMSPISNVTRRTKKGNLKSKNSTKTTRRVSFDPLALLLDAALEGELELVKKTAQEVTNPSAANDEGITALHNAICAGHYEIVKFLVEFGCDVNAQDSDGWTPLHCAASCNNLPMVKFLVEHGACIFATTLSDHETAAEKCEEDEEGFDGCTEYLYSIQEKLGILNNGIVYALYEYEAHNSDELSFKDGDVIMVLRKGDEFEREWWWSKVKDREGYIPRNLLGLHPRVVPSPDQ